MKKILIVALSALIVAGGVFLNQFIDTEVSSHLKTDRGAYIAELTKSMANRLGQDMNARAAEIEFLTNLNAIKNPDENLQNKTSIFETMKRSYPYYAWIGMTDAQGNILAGTDGLLVGKNVTKREWFIKGSQGLHFGDAHDAFLLAKLMPKPQFDDLPLRLVDVSAPIKDEDGNLLGVICGHLSVDWAFEVRNHMLGQQEIGTFDLIVLNDEGKVLMGTPFLPSLKTDLSHLKTWQQVAQGQNTAIQQEQWADGQNYLTSIASKEFLRSKLPINWAILAREKAIDDHELIGKIQNMVWIVAAVIIVLLVLLIAVLAGRDKAGK